MALPPCKSMLFFLDHFLCFYCCSNLWGVGSGRMVPHFFLSGGRNSILNLGPSITPGLSNTSFLPYTYKMYPQLLASLLSRPCRSHLKWTPVSASNVITLVEHTKPTTPPPSGPRQGPGPCPPAALVRLCSPAPGGPSPPPSHRSRCVRVPRRRTGGGS